MNIPDELVPLVRRAIRREADRLGEYADHGLGHPIRSVNDAAKLAQRECIALMGLLGDPVASAAARDAAALERLLAGAGPAGAMHFT